MNAATILVVEAAVIAVAAPLCGVALAVNGFRRLAAVTAAALILLALSLVISWPMAGTVAAHATLAVIAFALGAVGAWCGAAFADPLDAAACSTVAALAAVTGLIVAGPFIADLPAAAVNAALIANPVVAATSAADLDVLRSGAVYRLTPVAHGRFDYPSRSTTVLSYLTVGAVALAGTALARRRRRIVVAMLLACVAGPARAADQPKIPPKMLTATAGLGGLARAGRWTPVRVDVDYRGKEASGEIVVEWGDARVRRALGTLGAASKKQVELYIRTPDVRDSMMVRLFAEGRDVASIDVPIRIAGLLDPVTVCVAAQGASSASFPAGVLCSATVNPERLPHSWRGYAAADTVMWGENAVRRLAPDQEDALTQWRAVRSIEESDASLSAGPADSPRSETGVQMLLYASALAACALPLSRLRRRSLAVYPLVAFVVVLGSVIAFAVGRVGPGSAIRVTQSAVVHQWPDGSGSFVVARAIALFPAFDTFEIRAPNADGALGPDRQGLSFDENGAPRVSGTFGRARTRGFDVEAVTPFKALQFSGQGIQGARIRISNVLTQPLRDCRFSGGFSPARIDTLSPGQIVDVTRTPSADEALLTCALAAPVVEFTATHHAVQSDGHAIVVLHLPSGAAPQ